MKEDKYTKRLAKNQVYGIVHMRDSRKNVLPKFIKLCMEAPCLCPFQGHKYGRRKLTETSVFEFSYLDIFRHDGDTFSVNGAKVGVLEKTNQVGFASLLKSQHG